MQKKILFFSIVIALFLAVLFLDQNSAPVPVKIILGDPRPIGLSSIIVVSVMVGVLLSAAVVWLYVMIRKARRNQQLVEKNVE